MDFANATSGGIAAAAAAGAVYPLDTLLVRFQAAFSKRHGRQPLSRIFADALRHRDGFLGLYKGVCFKMLEALIRNFVYFYWYSLFKRAWQRRFGSLSTTSNLFVATAAAAMNQFATVPLEVISTNIQITSMSLNQVLKTIYDEEGIKGFYRGFGASLILCSNPAITSVTFDRLRLILQEPSKLSEQQEPLTSWQSFVLGAFAKALATSITYPYIRSKVFVQATASKRRKTRQVQVKEQRFSNVNKTTLNGPPRHLSR